MSGHSGMSGHSDPPRPDPTSLEEPEFSALMAALGPWPDDLRLAVAVSGGADSLALTLLTDTWFRGRAEAPPPGRFVALTVDHGLRTGAADEARQVGAWMAARGIEHHVLRWRGAKPASDLQAAARRARYRLLEGWCRRHRIDYLLVAHNLEDQAETFLLRLARGSGVDGLAAMASRRGTRPVLLRPLLDVPRARLEATLRAHGQDWIGDPSNQDTAFARVRMRRLLPRLAGEGLDPARLAGTARRMARARTALEHFTGDLLAGCASADLAGFVRLDPAPLVMAPEEIGLRVVAAVLGTVGGAEYRPRLARLERLVQAIVKGNLGRGRTLSGCRILLVPRRLARVADELLVVREPAAVAPPFELAPGRSMAWDGRFRVRRTKPSAMSPVARAWVGALGDDGWHQIRALCDPQWAATLPAVARVVLPTLRSARGQVLAVPHLGYARPGARRRYGRFRANFPPAQGVLVPPAGADKPGKPR